MDIYSSFRCNDSILTQQYSSSQSNDSYSYSKQYSSIRRCYYNSYRERYTYSHCDTESQCCSPGS